MTFASVAVVVVALLHAWFLTLEMFLWDKPLGLKTFRMRPAQAAATKTLATGAFATRVLPGRYRVTVFKPLLGGPEVLLGIHRPQDRVGRHAHVEVPHEGGEEVVAPEALVGGDLLGGVHEAILPVRPPA